MEERLQKVIASYGYCSRRKAEELITQGKVSVNGSIVKTLGTKVGPKDEIIVEGNYLTKNELVYYCLYKPLGVVSTANDEKNRTSVVDLVPNDIRVFPIGRLDYNTSGLILLTNDGELTNRLIHPTKAIEKVYQARVRGILTEAEIKTLTKGVDIGGYVTKPCQVKVVSVDKNNDSCLVLITITEGKYHQVRRMFEAVGHEVKKLKRLQFGNITLDGLSVGEYRRLKPYEIKQLKELAK